jgi:hypothetical protein
LTIWKSTTALRSTTQNTCHLLTEWGLRETLFLLLGDECVTESSTEPYYNHIVTILLTRLHCVYGTVPNLANSISSNKYIKLLFKTSTTMNHLHKNKYRVGQTTCESLFLVKRVFFFFSYLFVITFCQFHEISEMDVWWMLFIFIPPWNE